MKAYEIFATIKEDTAKSVFQFLRGEERAVYVAALTGLANNRKLRPVFVQKKSVPDQINWLVKNVKYKASNEVAENVLQLWLLKANPQMLIAFLDGLGIEHDGEGAAEDIPDEIDAKKLKSTTDAMLKEYGDELVKIYLNTFQMQRQGGWEEISNLIDSTPELQFSSQEKSTPSKEEEE